MTLIVVMVVCALIGILWLWSLQTDQAGRAREENLVRIGIEHLIKENTRRMAPTTFSEEAVKRLNSNDTDWIRARFGEHYINTLGYDWSFILDPSNQAYFAYGDEGVAQTSTFEDFRPHASTLLSRVRALPVQESQPLSDPALMGQLSSINGRLFMLAANPVRSPVSDTDDVSQAASPFVVVAVREITRTELQALSQQYMLSSLHIVRQGQVVPDDAARAAFIDDQGRTLVELTWIPHRPGYTLFMRAIGPVLLIAMGLGAVALFLLHQTQKTARNLIASEARAKHMAMHDALTGLPNRTLFTDRLTQALERVRRQGGYVAVHCIGLDRFKDVNDTLGHTAGDELIRHSATRISGMIRSGDTLARLGGDEFVIVQTDTNPHSAAALSKRILETLSGNVLLESGQVYSTCSIGVTLLQDPDTDPAEALRQADLALYRAKAQGRSQYAFFEVEMDATIKLRKLLEAGLREAIKTNAIDVVYQPQMDHARRIVGVEALARWMHPERGPISPAYFIPLAEECGLMNELGDLIMERAMIDSKRWPGLKVAINVSATQLRSTRFLARVSAILSSTGIPAQSIEMEITEGVLLNDDQITQQTLRELRQMGFSIALDDFGTGYSSLSYLNRYPVDKIKIDRSFVANLGLDPDAEAVIRAIIRLAKALNLNILAEGVETRGQRNILRQAGCQVMQGYLFSRPVEASNIDEMMVTQVEKAANTRGIVRMR
ncbi:MAG: EAL domain-containing protein [Asticcacaulis sp.]